MLEPSNQSGLWRRSITKKIMTKTIMVVKADEIEKNFDADGVEKPNFFQACMMVESAASNTS